MQLSQVKQDGLTERFWSKVDVRGENECWPWTRGTAKHGISRIVYGRFVLVLLPKAEYRVFTAHRVAYLLTHGRVDDNKMVRHTCDYGLCCNPKHLLSGTGTENAADRENRGRHPHPKKLELWQEREVVLMRKEHRLSYKDLAEMFGVGRTTIRSVLIRNGGS